jgi:cytochrome c-type biogenesis protein CcsB
MNDANAGDMTQKAVRRGDGFYAASTILYGIGFLTIAIVIAVAMAYLDAEKLSSRYAPYHLLSQHLISFANLLLIGSTFLYVAHLWVGAKAVGQLASGTATLGAMGVTVALLVRWFETNYMQQVGPAPFSTLYDVTALFSGATVVIYLAMEKVYHTRSAGAFVMPIVSAAVLFESFLLGGDLELSGHWTPTLKSYWVDGRILSNFVGYGAFAVASALAIMYLLRARAERRGSNQGSALRSLPDLQRIDHAMFQAIVLGFFSFTLGAILGTAWSYQESGQFWSGTGAEGGTLVVWSIYLAYFYGRFMRQWRGSRLAWLAIIGFGASVFCFAGMNLFLSGRYPWSP